MKRGVGTAIEAAQARQATAQARLVMVQATGALQNAYLTLISAMGISPMTQIKVADVSDRRLPPELAGSAEKIISVALARRPDILAAYAAQKMFAPQRLSFSQNSSSPAPLPTITEP
jgi:outer membrane protein